MATQNNNTVSRFDNISPSMLADLIGQLDRAAKAANAELDEAKDAFKSRGLLIAQGDAFAVSLQKTIRQSLDTAMVKASMGQNFFDNHSRLSEVSTLRIAAAKQPAMAA